MPTSKTIEFELRNTRITARRVVDPLGEYITTRYGADRVPPGDWIVKFHGAEWEFACTHAMAKVLFRPKDEALRKRWNQS